MDIHYHYSITIVMKHCAFHCDNEELVDVGLVPERETHNDDCGHEDLLDDDTNDVVSSLSVIPNEIVSYIIHLAYSYPI